MGIELREMRPADHAPLAALWAARTITPPVDDEASLAHLLSMNRALSVVALRDGSLVGAVLCVRDGAGGCTHTLAVDDGETTADLAGVLLGKVLVKMASQGVHRFRVHGADEDDGGVWQNVRWIDTDTAPADAARDEPAGTPTAA